MAEGILRRTDGGTALIHAFALEPAVVATWGRREEFRFIRDKFGFGTPRVMFELPAFSKWKRAVFEAAGRLSLTEQDMKRIEELFRLFSEHRCRRTDTEFDGLCSWLENAEHEHDRSPFGAIVASTNPRSHPAVLLYEQLGPGCAPWACEVGLSTAREPKAIAHALAEMVMNCRQLHLIDPHFGPENARHRKVLEALLSSLAARPRFPDLICVHCEAKSERSFFEQAAVKIAPRLPIGCRVEFVRWRQSSGREKLHNRYVLTEFGGVLIGTGLDEGNEGETDDLCLLSRTQYELRWSQYVAHSGDFERVDTPSPICGTRF